MCSWDESGCYTYVCVKEKKISSLKLLSPFLKHTGNAFSYSKRIFKVQKTCLFLYFRSSPKISEENKKRRRQKYTHKSN